ncbi:DUF6886 family protein [Xylophilus sp.]|uniref:DUF6886 family protein n=1 Tax=Xylophilus sp. TaxID=2653893 RepID=UPI0013B9BE52|nr:DUF6886 family protein [Xylophilus sp.]KAF1044798.1 MAG: hypothetical protein GAK38_03398 [Xylophilus sp.]
MTREEAATAVPLLWHVSDDPGITRFEPRLPPGPGAAVAHPVVWAVDDEHLVNYLFPRDCPRIAVRRSAGTSGEDTRRFLFPGEAGAVLFIEAPWFQRAAAAPLWLYRMPAGPFACADAIAGYFVSPRTVVPDGVRRIDAPLAELLARGAELRVVPRLRPVAEAVAASSLDFSIIRLRNALA